MLGDAVRNRLEESIVVGVAFGGLFCRMMPLLHMAGIRIVAVERIWGY